MNVRKNLAAAFQHELGETIRVVDNTSELGELDATVTGAVQFVRTTIEPTTRPSASVHTFEIWVLTPNTDPETADDDLDDLIDIVLSTLAELTWIVWSSASRDVYLDKYNAYRITAKASGKTIT